MPDETNIEKQRGGMHNGRNVGLDCVRACPGMGRRLSGKTDGSQ